MKADNISNVEPGKIHHRRLHRDWGEMGLVRESAYYDPQIVISLAFGEWTNEVHSYRLPGATWDGEIVE